MDRQKERKDAQLRKKGQEGNGRINKAFKQHRVTIPLLQSEYQDSDHLIKRVFICSEVQEKEV